MSDLLSSYYSLFSPYASFHCTPCWGNHPLPMHVIFIPSSFGPTMRTRGLELRPEKENHSPKTWIIFIQKFLVLYSSTSMRRWMMKHHHSRWEERISFLFSMREINISGSETTEELKMILRIISRPVTQFLSKHTGS